MITIHICSDWNRFSRTMETRLVEVELENFPVEYGNKITVTLEKNFLFKDLIREICRLTNLSSDDERRVVCGTSIYEIVNPALQISEVSGILTAFLKNYSAKYMTFYLKLVEGKSK